MWRRVAGMTILFLLLASISSAGDSIFDSGAPLCIKKVALCEDKPKGLGQIRERPNTDFRKGQPWFFLYAELSNCKAVKDAQDFRINLTIDIDIYYEDGRRIYSGEGVNTFDYRSLQRRSSAYIWAKIESTYLRQGEYKIEVTVHDENSQKKAFSAATFNVI